MYRFVLCAVLLGFVALTGCGKNGDEESKEKDAGKEKKGPSAALFKSDKPNDLDLSFVPADAVMVAVVNPQRMLKAPIFAKLDEKELAELAGPDNNLDIRQLKQVVTYMGVPNMLAPSEGGSPGGAIVRFNSPQDPSALAEQMFGTLEQQQVSGVTAYVGRQGQAAMVAIDETTILVAAPNELSKMIAAKSAKGPVAQKLSTVPTDKDVVGAFVMNESLRQMAGFMLGMATQSPDASPEVKEAAKIPANLQSATFLVDLSKEQFLNVAVEMKDNASAASMEKLAQKGMEMAKGQIATNSAQMFGEAASNELAQKNQRIVQQLVDSMRVAQEGNLVIATAEMPDDVDDAMVEAIIAARRAAELSKRKNDLKQIGLGLYNAHDTYGSFPPAGGDPSMFDESGKPHLSWRVHILPFIEQQNLYDQFHLDEPWDSEHNKALLSQMPALYESKSKDPTTTTILMVTGEGLAYEGGAGFKYRDFTDGTSNTVVVVDAGADKAVPWTKPVGMTVDPKNPIAALGQPYDFGFVALRCDASVLVIPKDIAAAELWAMFTRAGDD